MATDKRLDQVSNLSDFDYALIVKGEQVSKISKADLASVVAGLIGIDSSWFRSRSDISNTSLNSIKTNGIYYCSSVTEHPGSDAVGTLIVFSLNSNQCIQFFANPFHGTVYRRATFLLNGHWGNWTSWSVF